MEFLYITKKVQVLIDNIRYLQADINYTTIYTCQEESIISTTTIKRLNDKIESGNFIRINRKIIVNKEFIKAYNYWSNKVILDNGETFIISRRKNRALRNVLELQ
ncbi:LytTR family DNA-binding domain-containing protein [Emticicia sp. BO119]|uniref:LytR/AlgR family response regulator transcription factor n=1 Tax=Emticicia sp. BO119 TaxID=2757768 RepID=UPI0015F03AAE|nr:LytTR family DNA-binding domain-containing protein [Emticicia sp. BO119]MBA4850553.1 LytTR family transcriptional regulator DNA-binding domain-containing protein [Emticicia sp. BO119]